MTKDVLLSIVGLYSEDNDEEPSLEKDSLETLSPAEFYVKDGMYYIFYEELLEGVTGITKCQMKCKEKYFELTRKGEVSVQLLFEEGKKTLNTYQMPYGTLVVGLDTREIRIEESEDEIKIQIHYAMEIDYQQVSDNEISIVIKSVKAKN